MTDITIKVNNEVIVSLHRLVSFLLDIVKKQGLNEFMDSLDEVDIIIVTDQKSGGVHMTTAPRCDCDNCTKLRATLLQCLHSDMGSKETYKRLRKVTENMKKKENCTLRDFD